MITPMMVNPTVPSISTMLPKRRDPEPETQRDDPGLQRPQHAIVRDSDRSSEIVSRNRSPPELWKNAAKSWPLPIRSSSLVWNSVSSFTRWVCRRHSTSTWTM